MKRRKITSGELLAAIANLLVAFVRISIMLSFMMHFNFQPFDSPVKLDDYHLSFDLLSPAHLANTYLLGLLTYSYLSVGFYMTAFSEQAKGYYVQPIFLNPMLGSRTLTEFWGRRWNLMIHRFLKHGVMRPAKKYYSTAVSIFMAFIFSGLLHDYSWSVIFYHHSRDECATCLDCDHCFNFKPMKVSAFFLYCGLCMLLERPLAPYFGFLKSWPTPIVAQLVLLTGCPVSVHSRIVSEYSTPRITNFLVELSAFAFLYRGLGRVSIDWNRVVEDALQPALFSLFDWICRGGKFSDFALAVLFVRKL